jgi:hypothetical protein
MFSKKSSKISVRAAILKQLNVLNTLRVNRNKNLKLLKNINFILAKLNTPGFKNYSRNSYTVAIEFYHL